MGHKITTIKELNQILKNLKQTGRTTDHKYLEEIIKPYMKKNKCSMEEAINQTYYKTGSLT